jgi:prepilin-type N-terminal cleavage/methylation domain-containing protein
MNDSAPQMPQLIRLAPEPRESGFTLIEMSIVLVIIGLIVGGILVGQDLIQAAVIRSQISQVEKIETAINTFRSKYNCLPGDCPNASAYGLPMGEFAAANVAVTGAYNTDGDGDGIIMNYPNGNDQNAYPLKEATNVWSHLKAAGLSDEIRNCYRCIDPAVPDYCGPAMPAGTGGNYGALTSGPGKGVLFLSAIFYNGGPYYFPGSHYLTTAAVPGSMGSNCLMEWTTPLIKTALTPVRALNIDTKMDDGLPASGKVRSIVYTHSYPSFWENPDCGNTTAYSVTGPSANTASCDLGFKMGF